MQMKIRGKVSCIGLLYAVACTSICSAAAIDQPVRVEKLDAAKSESVAKQDGVFIFFDPSCPVCAEYFPTIERLNARFERSRFSLVFCAVDNETIADFVREYKPHCRLLNDLDGSLRAALDAHVTPQAVVRQAGKTIYSGRIDDRYASIGHRRAVIGAHDLETVLASINRGQPVLSSRTAAVGCFIESANSKKLARDRKEN
jgi:thiol-disulfide isomerase/thioredoxin